MKLGELASKLTGAQLAELLMDKEIYNVANIGGGMYSYWKGAEVIEVQVYLDLEVLALRSVVVKRYSTESLSAV